MKTKTRYGLEASHFVNIKWETTTMEHKQSKKHMSEAMALLRGLDNQLSDLADAAEVMGLEKLSVRLQELMNVTFAAMGQIENARKSLGQRPLP
jgi:hypothetical protein